MNLKQYEEEIKKEIENLERMRDGDLQLDCGLPIDKEVANKLFRHSLAEKNLWESQAKLETIQKCKEMFKEMIEDLENRVIMRIKEKDNLLINDLKLLFEFNKKELLSKLNGEEE